MVPHSTFKMYLMAALCFCISTIATAQEFDGLVSDLKSLEGKTANVEFFKGSPVDGTLSNVTKAAGALPALQSLEINVRNRERRIKPDQIKKLKVDDRTLLVQRHFPSSQSVLIDEQVASLAVDSRLNLLGKTRRSTISSEEYEKLSTSNWEFAKAAMAKVGGNFSGSPRDGSNVILISDYPEPQQRQLLTALDGFISILNLLFGYTADEKVLPGKPIIGAFLSRSNLGAFQSKVVGNPNYGTIRAFFHVVEDHVVVTAEDDRSPQHMTWQAAWGLSGAYSSYSYSDVELPAWVRIGFQQLCSDILVPRVAEVANERRSVLQELKTGSLNGILDAENLPGERQIVCKALMSHLYSLNSAAFGQMISSLKLGRTTEDALKLSYGFDTDQFVQSFGRSLGINGLQP